MSNWATPLIWLQHRFLYGFFEWCVVISMCCRSITPSIIQNFRCLEQVVWQMANGKLTNGNKPFFLLTNQGNWLPRGWQNLTVALTECHWVYCAKWKLIKIHSACGNCWIIYSSQQNVRLMPSHLLWLQKSQKPGAHEPHLNSTCITWPPTPHIRPKHPK